MNKNNKRFNKSLMAQAICMATLAFSSTAIAEEATAEVEKKPQLEVIEVTAQKTVQNIQDVPISVTAFNGGFLEKENINDLEQMSNYVPNLTISNSSINTNIYIRGVGSGNNRSFEQSVGMYTDGIYMGRDRQARAPFLDLERAEVLRGPQGILFGKNTIAGALNLTTHRATAGADLSGSIGVEYEAEYGSQSVVGILDTGITDELGVRFAGKASTSDGYIDNEYLNEDGPSVDETILRVAFNYQPNDAIDANLKIEHSSVNMDGSGSQVIKLEPLSPAAGFFANLLIPAYDPDFDTELNLKTGIDDGIGKEYRDIDSTNVALNVDYHTSNGLLTFVTGYSAYESNEAIDSDFTPVPFLYTAESQDFKQWSQEIRFSSTLNDKFSYMTGVYAQHNELDFDLMVQSQATQISPILNAGLMMIPAQALNPAAPAGLTLWDLGIRPENISRPSHFTQDTDTYSAFFQGTYSVSDDFRIIPGIRYTYEKKNAERDTMIATFSDAKYDEATRAGVNGQVTAMLMKVAVPLEYFEGDRSESHFTPSIKLQYDYNRDVMFYATAEQGFKGGGFNSSPDATAANQEFEEEKALGFEVGVKSDLWDGRARLNAAIFHTKFDDLQVTTFNGFTFEVGNAAGSVTQGVELDGQVLLTDDLTLTASAAYLDSYYTDYPNGPCTIEDIEILKKTSCDLKDDTTPFAPKFSSSIFLDYVTEISSYLEFRATFNVNYTDSYYVDIDLDENLKQDAYTTLNLRVGIAESSDTWDVAIVGKNLTDERSILAGTDVPLVSGGFNGYVDAPRTITLQATYRFE